MTMMTKVYRIIKHISRKSGLTLKRNFRVILVAVVIVLVLKCIQINHNVFVQRDDVQDMILKSNKNGADIDETGYRSNYLNTTGASHILAENKNKQVFGKPTIYPTDGYERAALLRKKCSSSIINDVRARIRAYYDETHHVFYCPLCKIASTFWSRVFKMFEYEETSFVKMHPYEINISDVLNSELYYSTSLGEILRSNGIWSKINVQDSFKFLFVRNPFDVLFSAFVDKIVGPNQYYWKVFKTELEYKKTDVSIKLCGADLKFGQFLQNVVKRFKATYTLDCHVNTLDACQPCTMNYTFVGKVETLKEDTFHILSKFNQSKTLEIFENQFISLYADDAIKDSTSGPFKWKDKIVECIPWAEALQRIWRKLQIKGVIGMHAFPLNDNEAEVIEEKQFIELLKKTRLRTTSKERKFQREYAFVEAYRSVPSSIINDIRKIYSRSFKLFDYDDKLTNFASNNTISSQKFKLFDYSNIWENYY